MTQSTGNPSITAAEQAYAGLGVRSIINASGSVTRYGGTRTRPEVLQLMTGAARVMVNIDELNRKAGEEIARLTGAEAGLVCSGAAGGLLLQAIACIAGTDPVKMRQLPDTTGMKNEIIIHTMHRFPYDQAYRAAGARWWSLAITCSPTHGNWKGPSTNAPPRSPICARLSAAAG